MKYQQLEELNSLPLFELMQRAREVHVANWPENEIQLCTLLSIKTGGCSEDCSYCAQSSRYDTGVKAERLMAKEYVLEKALQARAAGSTRFCMGAAWKGVKSDSAKFNDVLDIVRAVSGLGMEVCVTLGQLGAVEAEQLKEAGVTAYNHNIDTSPEHYPNIVTTHTFEDRLGTIRAVQDAGMSVCCGGILGLGEGQQDRLRMLEVISEFNPAPESVPINALMAMPGTPLEEQEKVNVFDIVRVIAMARIALPKSKVRLSAGRAWMTDEAQTLCFFAGANSIFYGDKLLTAKNAGIERDKKLIAALGMRPQAPNPNLLSPEADAQRPLSPAGECDGMGGCGGTGDCHKDGHSHGDCHSHGHHHHHGECSGHDHQHGDCQGHSHEHSSSCC